MKNSVLFFYKVTVVFDISTKLLNGISNSVPIVFVYYIIRSV